VRFLIDTQLPRRLAAWVRAQGNDADHVLDLALAQSKDNAIWLAATESGAIIVSKDEDFATWIVAGRAGPSVLWLRTGNGSTPDLHSILERIWPSVVARFEAGERLVEVRR
jgi:predicted nuclease of predicted toxin-antitoxin system